MEEERRSISRVDEAGRLFATGHSCAQALAIAFAPSFGVAPETAFRMAGGFGAGVGRAAGICGAVSGAVMALGMAFAGDHVDPVAKERLYGLARDFQKMFAEKFGSINCRELLPDDISIPAGHEAVRASGAFKSQCPMYVRGAAEIVEMLLERENGAAKKSGG